MNRKMDFEKDVRVDKHNLEEEWERQPELSFKYCMEEALLTRKVETVKMLVDEAKTRLKQVESTVYVDVCENPDKWGLVKTTNPLIEATVQNSGEVQQAQKEFYAAKRKLIEAQYDLDVVKAAVQAVTVDKRQALSSEVDLWSRGYFATPKTNMEGDERTKVEKTMANQKMMRRRNSKQE